MKKYQTKPEVVEACQFTGTQDSFREIRAWIGEAFYYENQERPRLLLASLMGKISIKEGTWIVKQFDIIESHETGEKIYKFIVMRDDQFQNMYTCYCDYPTG